MQLITTCLRASPHRHALRTGGRGFLLPAHQHAAVSLHRIALRPSSVRAGSQLVARAATSAVARASFPAASYAARAPGSAFSARLLGLHLYVLPNPSLKRDPARQAAWASWRAGLCCTTPPKRLTARVALSSNVRRQSQLCSRAAVLSDSCNIRHAKRLAPDRITIWMHALITTPSNWKSSRNRPARLDLLESSCLPR